MASFPTANRTISALSAGVSLSRMPVGVRFSDESNALIDKLLLEKLALAGIARVVGVSEPWRQDYVNEKLAGIPRTIAIDKKKAD